MNYAAFLHKPKSEMTFNLDNKSIQIRFRCEKGDATKVSLLWGDPFEWKPSEDKTNDNYVWANNGGDNGTPLLKMYTTEHHDYWQVTVTPPYFRVKYAFIIENDTKKIFHGSRYTIDLKADETKKFDLFNYFNMPYLNYEDKYDAPKWATETIWYQIFPERFCKSTDKPNTIEWNSTLDVDNHMFFGGDINGITSKLEYIKDLGATGVYFTPIFESPSSHKYDTTDYFKIDPAFGTNEDFKQLVEKAHELGLRVMLDAVFNHSGSSHPFFQDVLKNGKESKYYDCFYIHKEDEYQGVTERYASFTHDNQKYYYETFALNCTNMPKLNTKNPIMREHLLDASAYWIEKYDIDGWRLDVSNEVAHEFWREFHTVCRNAKSDIFILGENWDNSNPWLAGDQFDAVMNYEWTYPVWSFFGGIGEITYTATQFMQNINKVLADYPEPVCKTMFNPIDSHDTERMLHRVEENKDRLKQALVFQMTFSGAPSIYYGTEIGISGAHDPKNRRCMIWEEEEQDLELKTFVQTLVKLRKKHSAFRSVPLKWHLADDDKNVIIYEKQPDTTNKIDKNILVIINNNSNAQSINIPAKLIDCNCIDLLTNESITLKNSIELSAYQTLVLAK